MKQIQLTDGQWAKVDDDDYEWLMEYTWDAEWNSRTRSFYAITILETLGGKKVKLYMHEMIWERMTEAKRDKDHAHLASHLVNDANRN